ncbi:MAG: hypothetical protein PHF86_06290 [Candidatus Nanoarchaeia archaeon]|nr:hypothetical protein [Candidatus Nanoarchaeia archaeon]
MSKKNKVAVENYQISNNFLATTIGRRKAIEKLSAHEGLQTFYTPFGLADSMINGNTEGTIRVFFNLEFLEVLLNRKKDMSKVQYVGDTERKCRFAKLLYKVETVLIDKENWERILKKEKQIGEFFVSCKMNQAADVTFSNPPYTRNMDLKIIMSLQESGLLKNLICVHPSSWLLDVKTQIYQDSGNACFRNFRKLAEEYLINVRFFNGNPVFNITLFVPCAIIEFSFLKKRNSMILVKEIDESQRKVSSINEITLHGKNWYLLKNLMDKIKLYTERKETLLFKWILPSKAINIQSKYFVQLPCIRGNVNISTMTEDDFYTLLQQDSDKNKGIRSNSPVTMVFSFNSEKEQNNFISYLKTDFARLCVSILKASALLNGGTKVGELLFVPWLDFMQSWNDDKLFSFFGYEKGHPIREYSKKFLPDYYKLYGNGKKY